MFRFATLEAVDHPHHTLNEAPTQVDSDQGDDDQKAKSKKALERSNGFIRNELKPSIKSRWLPELRFFYDDTLEQAQKINTLISKIHDSAGSEE